MTDHEAMRLALQPTSDPTWILGEAGDDPLRDSSRESRFSTSNGFLGVRGTKVINRGARPVVPPSTYVAGLFDTATAADALSMLVPAPDWLQIRFSLSGEPPDFQAGELASHHRTLDMNRGILLTEWRQSDRRAVGANLRTLHLVSQHERGLGLQLIHLEIEDLACEITIEASFEGLNFGLVPERLEAGLGVWRTGFSGKTLAMAVRSSLQIDGHDLPPNATGALTSAWTWISRPGQILCFERLVAVVRSDIAGAHPGRLAQEKLAAARQLGWRGVVAAHEAAWAGRWRCSDVEVDAAAQQALRFASPN